MWKLGQNSTGFRNGSLHLLGSAWEAELFPLTSVIILAWPKWVESLVDSRDRYDRFNHLLLSGCKLRLKRPAYYDVRTATEESFKADLRDAGWLSLTNLSDPPSPLPPLTFESEEEEENYKQRLEFYGNPPFRWGTAEKKQVFPKSP